MRRLITLIIFANLLTACNSCSNFNLEEEGHIQPSSFSTFTVDDEMLSYDKDTDFRSIWVIDTKSDTILRRIDFAISPSNCGFPAQSLIVKNKLYVVTGSAPAFSYEIWVIYPDKGTSKRITLKNPQPDIIMYSSKYNRILVCHSFSYYESAYTLSNGGGNETLTLINPDTDEVDKVIWTYGGIGEIVEGWNGDLFCVYPYHSTDDKICKLELNPLKLTPITDAKDIPSWGNNHWGGICNPFSNVLYAANFDSNIVRIYDISNMQSTGIISFDYTGISTNCCPLWVQYYALSNYLIVGHGYGGRGAISIVNPVTKQVIKWITNVPHNFVIRRDKIYSEEVSFYEYIRIIDITNGFSFKEIDLE